MLGNRKSNSRRGARVVVIFTVVAAFLAGVVYSVFLSPLFVIQNVEINGAKSTDISVFDGIEKKNILFWKSPVGADDLPYVSDINIKKDFINRSLVINLTERDRDIIWCMQKSGECFWADENGLIFSSAPRPEGTLIVKAVNDNTDRDLSIGDRVLSEDFFKNLILIFNLLDSVDVSVTEVRIDDLSLKEVNVLVANGPEIYFSLLNNPEFGRSVINSLKESGEWDMVNYVDLRVENRAYYSL